MHSIARKLMLSASTLALGAWACAAQASDLLGFYAGGSVGQSTQYVDAVAGGAQEHDAAWKIMVGLRPLPFVGAEAEYFDLGSPSTTFDQITVSARTRGPAAFGVVYLPYPVGDLFVKAGVASATSRAYVSSVSDSGTLLYASDQTKEVGAWGGGGQIKLLNAAVRLEYEAFNVASGRQGLISAGLIWSF